MKGLTAPQQAAGLGSAPHILVVDDDENMRELLRLYLKDGGYQVSTAEDAVEAGHRVMERMPHLIIADFKMPYMDGVEFIRAMRQDVTIPDIPVIFMTNMENSDQLVGKTFGFPLLIKPLLAHEVLETVARELHLHASRTGNVRFPQPAQPDSE
jgi:two-component system OmpR family response regulator